MVEAQSRKSLGVQEGGGLGVSVADVLHSKQDFHADTYDYITRSLAIKSEPCWAISHQNQMKEITCYLFRAGLGQSAIYHVPGDVCES